VGKIIYSLSFLNRGAWVSLFRYEEADTCKPANGTGEVPLPAEPPGASRP